MPENKHHWYDGWIYDRFIAPHQDLLFTRIKKLIEPESRILDVGCGTGRFSFMVADRASYVLGIDLSERNILRARENLSAKPVPHLEFRHATTDELISEGVQRFDYAVMTFMIHEVDASDRAAILGDVSRLARTIIIGDYKIPMEDRWSTYLTHAIEFGAGRDHYRNFRSYEAAGGIPSLGKEKLHLTSESRLNEYSAIYTLSGDEAGVQVRV